MNLELVEKVEHPGTDVASFRFDSDANVLYKAGQYVEVDMHAKKDEKGPTRCFTLSSSPTEDLLMITTKIRQSPFKQKLADTKIGTLIQAKLPEGKFVLPEDKSIPIVFLSGGIGVTPFRSMLRFASDRAIPNKITMFDSNKTKASILFKEEFDKIEKKEQNINIIYTLTGEDPPVWEGEWGRIDGKMLKKYIGSDLDSSRFYICGPPGMLKSLHSLLNKEGIPESSIVTEEFEGY